MIHGGFILLARKLLESDLMERPPLWSKLWLWMLLRAEWRSNAKLPRGSFFTSIDEMRDAMSHMVGYRKERPTRDEVRSAYEGFAKATAITTAKTTRGMIISIINYGIYQSPENYESRNESPSEIPTKPQVTPHYSKEVQEEKKKDLIPPHPPSGGYSPSFEEFWSVYPLRKGKAAAFRAWKAVPKKHPSAKAPAIIAAVKAQVAADAFRGNDGQLFIPHPATWLNQGRWDDDIRGASSTDPTAGMTLAEKLEHARQQQ